MYTHYIFFYGVNVGVVSYRLIIDVFKNKNRRGFMELGNMFFGNSRGEFEVPRGEWQDLFIEFLYDIGLDGYGFITDKSLKKYETDRGGFENDTFLVNPYYWGEDESIAEEPNFVFKPNGLCIDWYKYPFRDSYSNMELTFDELSHILSECKSSVAKCTK